jgi:hypothetical protein
MTEKLWMEYLEHLHDTLPKSPDPYVLFVDQHTSRFGIKGLRLAKKYNFIIIAFPPNLTWLLQVHCAIHICVLIACL